MKQVVLSMEVKTARALPPGGLSQSYSLCLSKHYVAKVSACLTVFVACTYRMRKESSVRKFCCSPSKKCKITTLIDEEYLQITHKLVQGGGTRKFLFISNKKRFLIGHEC